MDRPQGATLCMLEADLSIDYRATTTIVSRAMMVEAAPGPKVPRRNFVSTARRNLTTLKNVGNCRIRRRGKLILMVRLVLLPLVKTLSQIVWLSLPVVLLVMMSGFLILHVPFISALTEIGSVH